MYSTPLSLGFKGERSYIQAADMINATMQCITSHAPHARIEKLDFKISRITSYRLTCHWWPRSTPQSLSGTIVANFTCQLDGIEHEGKLIQAEGCADTRRAYDESPVHRLCTYIPAHRAVSLMSMPNDFSQIEILVSMNKALLDNELNLSSGSKWVFCRWESPHWPLPSDLSGTRLMLERTLGTRLTRSRIELNVETIGTISFSALKIE